MDPASTDSSSESSSGEDGFVDHRRKRRKMGHHDARERAALGIFGSDSDDDGARKTWKSKTLRSRGVGFVHSDSTGEATKDASDDAFEGPFGRGFVPSSAQAPVLNVKPPSEAEEEKPKVVRPSFNSSTPMRDGRGTPDTTRVNSNSFAAKLMAKMGYKPGHGLGASGQGILNPVETKLRPQGAGLGAVKERTRQAKEEAKREATRQGKVFEDSSDEEQARRRSQRKKQGSNTTSGASTPRERSRRKDVFRTTAEIEATGLQVPSTLKSVIIDARGTEKKLLTSTSGLMTPTSGVDASVNENIQIARRAALELQAFADDWNNVQERKKYIAYQSTELQQQIQSDDDLAQKLESLNNTVLILQGLCSNQDPDDPDLGNVTVAAIRFKQLVSILETQMAKFEGDLEVSNLSEIAVAAIHPAFRNAIDLWQPLEDPDFVSDYLRRIKPILGVSSEKERQVLLFQNGRPSDHYDSSKRSKSTTPYETMMYTIWLPKIRSIVTNSWDIYDPDKLIDLIKNWQDLLPPFVYHHLVDQLIVQRLSKGVKDWDPKRRRHSRPPQLWLFDWLPYLSDYQRDPKSPSGLVADVKRKFKVVLDTWDLSKGLVDGLEEWKGVLDKELDATLTTHLLPRLARYLNAFEINPEDQKMNLLEDVLKWSKFFKASTMAYVLVNAFFPKWHHILYVWLTSKEPDYAEISEWYTWWKDQIPDEINEVPVIKEEWDKGLRMMDEALTLGESGKKNLQAPPAEPAKPVQLVQPKVSSNANGPHDSAGGGTLPEEPTFRTVLEGWSSEHDLFVMPLRKAHAQTGLPLLRLTASATGKGGVIIYLKGDLVWAQNKKNRETWEPMDLDQGLVDRAEGR